MRNLIYRIALVGSILLLSSLGCKLLTGEVAGEEPSAAEPTEALTGVPFIVDVVTATDVEPESFEPVGVTSEFSTAQSTFHCVVITYDAPPNTAFKAVWKVVNVEGIESGFLMGEYELIADGTKNIDFMFAPSAGALPPGDYQVQIFVNGVFDREVMFSVNP